MFLGCCDNTNNGPHYVNAASKHDGPTDPTDEPPFLGHNRNGKIIAYAIYFLFAKWLLITESLEISSYSQVFSTLTFSSLILLCFLLHMFFSMPGDVWPCLCEHVSVPFIMSYTNNISDCCLTVTRVYRYCSTATLQSQSYGTEWTK